MNTIHILYKPARNIPQDALILSFLPPEDERGFAPESPSILFARNEMNNIRDKARKAYVDLVARIASTPCAGKTLRQALEIEGKGNPWWYHKTGEKQSEGDNTFNLFLQIFTILSVCERERVDEIIIYGSLARIADVLATRYNITRVGCVRCNANNPIKGFLSRMKYLGNALYTHKLIKRGARPPDIKPKVIFQGFWDWSVGVNQEGKMQDSYFRSMPEYFKDSGIEYSWLLWFDPHFKAGSKGRKASEVLRPALEDSRLIFAQGFLNPVDIFSAIFDFSYLFSYLRYRRSGEFRAIFREEGCDFWPLFKNDLLYYFSDASMPHYFLMETAYRRAAACYKPKMIFGFMQFFLFSRAFYQGVKFGYPAVIKCDMQHAGYGREKTFILMDRERELLGNPDDNGMPVPDYFFTMGELCREILVEDGFLPEKIFVTGSARYDYIWGENNKFQKRDNSTAINVLIVTSVAISVELEMIQAVFLASQGLNLKLYLRSHPFARIEDTASYKPYSGYIVSTSSSLEDDLKVADLVLFTYSTVAEEAFIRGIPILQWHPCGFNGSVFRDIKIIPSAYSVEGLRTALKSFINDPASFRPSPEQIGLVLNKCFYKMDAQASSRIAQKAIEILKTNEN